MSAGSKYNTQDYDQNHDSLFFHNSPSLFDIIWDSVILSRAYYSIFFIITQVRIRTCVKYFTIFLR